MISRLPDHGGHALAASLLALGVALAPLGMAYAETPPANASAPGTIEVDPELAARALERTLTAEGALLLTPGRFDIEPYLNYARRERSTPLLFSLGGVPQVRNLDVNRNEFDLGLRIRAGLPWDFQAEFDLPYRWVDQSTGIVGLEDNDKSGSTMGDIKIGLARTLMRESGWRPDLVGRITWNTGTGDIQDGDVSLGQGFNKLRFGLTALKRQDPLAFTASLAYSAAFERDDITPGDEWSAFLGMSLAASPQSSLSIGISQSFIGKTELDGREIPDTDQVSSLLNIGASTIIAPRTLLTVNLGVGLTDDAPEYVLSLSVPIRL